MASAVAGKAYQRKKSVITLLEHWYILEEKLGDIESSDKAAFTNILSNFVKEEDREMLNFYLARKQILARIRLVKQELAEEVDVELENSPSDGEQNTSLDE